MRPFRCATIAGNEWLSLVSALRSKQIRRFRAARSPILGSVILNNPETELGAEPMSFSASAPGAKSRSPERLRLSKNILRSVSGADMGKRNIKQDEFRLQQDRAMVDAIREALGMDPLFSTFEPERFVTSSHTMALGDGCRRAAVNL